MFWTEDNSNSTEYKVPDDVVDISFKLDCRTLPLDHAHALANELLNHLPWLAEEEQAGIHQIHVAESGNGWQRPEDPENEVLCLSRRTKMQVRVPKHRIDEALGLEGVTLDIEGHTLSIRDGSIKPFLALPTLFARYVASDVDQDETGFLQAMAQQIQAMGIPVKKLMAGKQSRIQRGDDVIYTRSLMVADLKQEDSIQLQQTGIGSGRLHGCGLFIPQKGIKAVNAQGE